MSMNGIRRALLLYAVITNFGSINLSHAIKMAKLSLDKFLAREEIKQLTTVFSCISGKIKVGGVSQRIAKNS